MRGTIQDFEFCAVPSSCTFTYPASFSLPRSMQLHERTGPRLYAQGHDTVDDVVVVLLERLDGLLPADAGLSHHKLDVLRLKTGVVDFLTIVLLLLSLLRIALNGLALVGTLGGVIVASLVGRLRSELLSGGGLSLGVEVLDLSLTEDARMKSAVFSSSTLDCFLTSKCWRMATCRRLGC